MGVAGGEPSTPSGSRAGDSGGTSISMLVSPDSTGGSSRGLDISSVVPLSKTVNCLGFGFVVSCDVGEVTEWTNVEGVVVSSES